MGHGVDSADAPAELDWEDGGPRSAEGPPATVSPAIVSPATVSPATTETDRVGDRSDGAPDPAALSFVDLPFPMHRARAWPGVRSYKEDIRVLAQAIVDAQRPVRILQALHWEPGVEEAFRRSGFREPPRMGPEEYAKTDLGFEPETKAREFEAILRAIERQIGSSDPLGRILLATAFEYREVVRMLAVRGQRDFYRFSRALYGSPKDRFPDGKTTVRALGEALRKTLRSISTVDLGPSQRRDIPAALAAEILRQRFSTYFQGAPVQVDVDDTILADASAGSDYVKIRQGAHFSHRDLDLLEVHEGWVHVATSLNGQRQPIARWLAKGPPRTTAVQEGLAAMMELLTYRSYPKRALKLNDRILAVDKAEDGAGFLDVFEWYRTEGYEESEAFANTRRVFRGGLIEGGAPFTKDACYGRGLALNYAFIRAALRCNRAEIVPCLFLGKLAHEDVPVLYEQICEGLVEPPVYVPALFRDLNGLAMGMAYSDFLSGIAGAVMDDYYADLFRRAGP